VYGVILRHLPEIKTDVIHHAQTEHAGSLAKSASFVPIARGDCSAIHGPFQPPDERRTANGERHPSYNFA
jgi:hypothetical protein